MDLHMLLHTYRNTALQKKVKKYQVFADFLTMVGENSLNSRGKIFKLITLQLAS